MEECDTDREDRAATGKPAAQQLDNRVGQARPQRLVGQGQRGVTREVKVVSSAVMTAALPTPSSLPMPSVGSVTFVLLTPLYRRPG
eukprot:7380612-Prymnesium_polylepis.1